MPLVLNRRNSQFVQVVLNLSDAEVVGLLSSMSEEKCPRKRVAVIGSGLAGLTAAYLLQKDRKQRYEVIVFESVSISVHRETFPELNLYRAEMRHWIQRQ